MKVPVLLDDRLVDEAERLAKDEGRGLGDVIEDALRARFEIRLEPKKAERRLRLPTLPGWGLKPGVNLDSNAALADLLDERDADG